MEEKPDYFWPVAVIGSILALMAVVKFTQSGTTTVPPEAK